MTFIPRPGHPPTSPMLHEPVSGLIGTLALLAGASSGTAAVIGAVGAAVIGVAASTSIAFGNPHDPA